MQIGDKEKQKSLDVAEDSRQTEWKDKSFVAELFQGNFCWNYIHPYPAQSAEEKKIGDEFIAKVKGVLEQYVNPSEVDRTGEVPPAALKALADIGAFGMKIDKKYGGLSFSHTNYSRTCAYIYTYCTSTGAWVTAHQSIGVPQPLKHFGTEEQKQKFLPRLAKGEISAFALTEPDVGSDPARIKTFGTPTEDGKFYILNGEKLWITNGPAADILVVMAQTPPKIVRGKERQQITAFIVEKSMPGFEAVHRCRFMGINGISNGVLRFNNVKVPVENIIGEPGQGLKIALATLNTGRLSLPATASTGAKQILNWAKDWARERKQWGACIGNHQSTSIKVARFASDTFAMEAVTWLCCAMADAGDADIRIEAAMAKYFTTEFNGRVIDDFLQVRGGRGYETAESLAGRGETPIPIERISRDARIARILEGTSEIMQLFIAREAMDIHVRQIMPMMMPGPVGDKVKHIFKSFLPFYAKWYPKQWLPSSQDYNVKYLSGENQAHLNFIASKARKLARTMFHTMARYQQKLEREQLIMANFVDIGTNLFAMAATLAYAEHLLATVENKEELQAMVNLFCKEARKRVNEAFKAVTKNYNRDFSKIARHVMDGKYNWMIDGIYDEVPPGYKALIRDLGPVPQAEAKE